MDENEKNNNKPIVLVAEDDIAILEIIQTLLEMQGYDVTALSDGRAVIDTIQIHLPTLILLDVWMPGINGIELTKRLKADEKTQIIPVILISAHSELSTLAKEVGADDYIAKPFDIEYFVQTVKKHIPNFHGPT